MAAQSKSVKSIVKGSLANSRIPSTATRKIVFAHKAAAGETYLDLAAMTVPPEYTALGFAQPSTDDIKKARVLFFHKNLRLVSNVNGTLIEYVDYTVGSNTQINFTATFGASTLDEIFTGYIEPVVLTGNMVVDIDPVVVTGTLAGSATDINIGKAKNILNLNEQIGAVEVVIDGQVFLRNLNNSTAAPANPDGNYEEVDGGAGQFTVVRLNDSTAGPRSYIVKSTAYDSVRPDGSLLDIVERQQGTIDKMVEDLAVVTGNPETNYQVAPSQPILKNFGDRVIALERFRAVVYNSPLATRTANGPVDRILFSTTPGVGTIVLPLTPVVGDWVEVWDSTASWGTNTATFGRNGNLIEGVAADFTVSTAGVKLRFVWAGGALGWIIGSVS